MKTLEQIALDICAHIQRPHAWTPDQQRIYVLQVLKEVKEEGKQEAIKRNKEIDVQNLLRSVNYQIHTMDSDVVFNHAARCSMSDYIREKIKENIKKYGL